MPPHTFALRVACATEYNRPTSKLQWGCLRSSNIGASQHVKRLRRRPFDRLADVALYNEDFDQPGAVPAADRLRADVGSADALLLVTPEYNGTMSAALKNAIDWISRPFGAGVISGKPVAVIGTSHGQYGGCGRTMTRASQHASRGQMCSMISSCRCLRHTPASQASIPSTTRRSPP